MDLSKKPCVNCGAVDRYNDKKRRCRPCTRAKQRLRNQANRLPHHIEAELRGKRNNEAKAAQIRENAKNLGKKQNFFISETPCYRCGNKLRLICNHGCLECS